jgi:tight adherence protein C
MRTGSIALGIAFGGLLGLGVLLIRESVTVARRSSLATRLDPYIGVSAKPPTWSGSFVSRLARIVGGEEELARHLRAAGRDESVMAFRARQAVVWTGTSGVFLSLAVALRLAGVAVSLGSGVLSGVLVGAGGPVALQVKVRLAAARRRLACELELPAVADLLSLCMSAGETLRSAVERVARYAGGVLGRELQRVVDEVARGVPFSQALESLADRLDLGPATRLIDTLQVARERGVPVATVLRAQAGDLRSAATRRLVEAAGRRQVAMLAPVVFLILPVCVLFAFYPALVSLQQLAR